MKPVEIKKGDRVLWTYSHYQGLSRYLRTKEGEYSGLCRHTVKHWRKLGAVQMAYVGFEGNSRVSCVPLHELKLKE